MAASPAPAPAPAPAAPAQAPAPRAGAARSADPASVVATPYPDVPAVADAAPQPVAEPIVKAQGAKVSIAETFTIPADSVLGLELEHSVSSETAQPEDRVDARVTRDVK